MKDIKSPLRDIYKQEFKEALIGAVGMHKQIGFRQDHPCYLQYETPRWETQISIKDLDLDLPSYEEQRKADSIILFFRSSQCDFHMWFTITNPTPEEVRFLNSEDAYEHFRTLKYEILNALDYGNKRLENFGNAVRKREL
tara:strand:- start:438 stop:857 length:420 start_codon:yes stop_codon:yes gene_type:complete